MKSDANRPSRIGKWAGLSICLIIIIAWGASLRWAYVKNGLIGYSHRSLAVTRGSLQYRAHIEGESFILAIHDLYNSKCGWTVWPTDWTRESLGFVLPSIERKAYERPAPHSPPGVGETNGLTIPLWVPLFLAIVVTRILFRRDALHMRPGHCPYCGYNLTGAAHDRCPECGRPNYEGHESVVDGPQQSSATLRRPRYRLYVIIAIGCLAACAYSILRSVARRPFESNSIADVSWTVGGFPGEIICLLTDAEGRPVPNVDLRLHGGAGSNLACTDKEGRLAMDFDPPAICSKCPFYGTESVTYIGLCPKCGDSSPLDLTGAGKANILAIDFRAHFPTTFVENVRIMERDVWSIWSWLLNVEPLSVQSGLTIKIVIKDLNALGLASDESK